MANPPFASVSPTNGFPNAAASLIIDVPSDAVQVMAQEFRVAGTGRVRVSVPGARVRLRPSTRDDRVQITVSVATDGAIPAQDVLDRMQLSTRQVKDAVQIESDGPAQTQDPAWWRWVRQKKAVVYLDVHLPADSNLEVEAPGGRIDAEGIDGTVTLTGSGGSVRACDLQGALTATVRGGDVLVSGVDAASVSVTVSSGTLQVENVAADRLEVISYASPVHLTNLDAPTHLVVHGSSATVADVRNRMTASVRGGMLSLDGVGGHVDCEAVGGSVTARLPASLSADLHFDADEVDLDDRLPFRGDREPDHVAGRLNNGGTEVRLRAVRGTVRCNRQ